MIPASSLAFAEHIFNPEAYAQYLDISQLESEKVTFTFDEKSYDIYYGYRGSLDSWKMFLKKLISGLGLLKMYFMLKVKNSKF
jgi:hypothetical protein